MQKIGGILRSNNMSLRIGIHDLEKNTKGPTHWHDYYEMEIVLKGYGTHHYNGKDLALRPGSAYLTTFHDAHSIDTPGGIQILNIAFPEHILPDSLISFLSVNPNVFQCQFSKEKTAYFVKRYERLAMEVQNGLLFSETNFRSLSHEILIAILRESCHPSEHNPLHMQNACAYIHRHFQDDLKLKDLAEYLNLSPNYCGSLFFNTFHSTFNQYLLDVRLKAACRMLTASNISIADIAKECGFKSKEYFYQSFKKVIGSSPRSFRMETQKQSR